MKYLNTYLKYISKINAMTIDDDDIICNMCICGYIDHPSIIIAHEGHMYIYIHIHFKYCISIGNVYFILKCPFA